MISAEGIKAVLRRGDWLAAEQDQLARLVQFFATHEAPPDPVGLYPRAGEYRDQLRLALTKADPESLEESFLTLYAHIHGHEAPYTPVERRRVNQTGGYWCHAGGLSPLLKSRPYLHRDTISTDFGAGNGLQGLLFQFLNPHRRTVQIEISGRMIEAGRALQAWLGIPAERVDWVHADICRVEPRELEFVYLYRPVRPEGEGRTFYERLAVGLDLSPHPVTIFSIADCLRPFLSSRFIEIYSDGHLTCFAAQP